MIIPSDPEAYSFRYLPEKPYLPRHYFFAGGNVAFRRDALKPLAYFDTAMLCGEDIDASIRLRKCGAFFSNPTAEVLHTSNFTVSKILAQWFLYAKFVIPLVLKHSSGGIELALVRSCGSAGGPKFRLIYYRPLSRSVFVYLSAFLLFNVGFWIAVLSAAMGFALGVCFAVLVCLVSGYVYFRNDWRVRNIGFAKLLLFLGLRFVVNCLLLYVSLFEGLKEVFFSLITKKTERKRGQNVRPGLTLVTALGISRA